MFPNATSLSLHGDIVSQTPQKPVWDPPVKNYVNSLVLQNSTRSIAFWVNYLY